MYHFFLPHRVRMISKTNFKMGIGPPLQALKVKICTNWNHFAVRFQNVWLRNAFHMYCTTNFKFYSLQRRASARFAVCLRYDSNSVCLDKRSLKWAWRIQKKGQAYRNAYYAAKNSLSHKMDLFFPTFALSSLWSYLYAFGGSTMWSNLFEVLLMCFDFSKDILDRRGW